MKNIFAVLLLLVVMVTGAYAEGRTVETMVVGVGRSKKEALQDAFNIAVKQLNETYVDLLVKSGHKDVPPIERQSLSQYKVINEKHENGLVYLAVSILVKKQDTLVNASTQFEPENLLDRDLTLASFAQQGLKSSKSIVAAMVEPETMIADGYQFTAVGQPKIEEVLADSIKGYIPVWIGRNSTFWLEYFDLLKRLEPSGGGINHGWYASLYETDLRETKGYSPLPFDIQDYRIAKNIGGVRVGSDIAEMLGAKLATISIPKSSVSLDILFDRNLIVAGYDPFSTLGKIIGEDNNKKNPPTWYLAPGWLEIANNKSVLSAPVGAPLYISPDALGHLGEINNYFSQYFDIYEKTQKSQKKGKELVTERRGLYSGWGENLAVGTTGLGFIVKVPFEVKNPQALRTGKNLLEISVSSCDRQTGRLKINDDITSFELKL